MPRDVSIEANLNNPNRSSGSETSLLSEQSAESAANLNTTCLVDESIFKIPPNYRCINYYADNAPVSPSGGASRGAAAPYYHHHRPTSAVDEDDILLQLAIQRSLGEGQADEAAGEENLTALEVIAGNRQGGIKRKTTIIELFIYLVNPKSEI